MSEIVHYKGTATKVILEENQTVEQCACKILKESNIEVQDYYDSALDQLCDELTEYYFFYPNEMALYSITKEDKYDPDNGIINASKREDGTIEFELKFYNGGASFGECLEEAMDKL